MLILRRFLVLAGLFFWQGGFTFYASVVVPVAQEVFGHLRQGFVTRQVTVYLNLAGGVVLLILFLDLVVTRDPSKWRRRGRWSLWGSMLLSLLWLFWLHACLDAMLVTKGRLIRDVENFYPQHRLYLWISTVQWACGLLYLFLTLGVWRTEDRLAQKDEVVQSPQ